MPTWQRIAPKNGRRNRRVEARVPNDTVAMANILMGAHAEERARAATRTH
jgi:hypothetical protein